MVLNYILVGCPCLLVYVFSLYVKYFSKRFLCYCNRSPIDKEFFSRCDPPRNDFTLRMSNSPPFSGPTTALRRPLLHEQNTCILSENYTESVVNLTCSSVNVSLAFSHVWQTPEFASSLVWGAKRILAGREITCATRFSQGNGQNLPSSLCSRILAATRSCSIFMAFVFVNISWARNEIYKRNFSLHVLSEDRK